MSARQVLHWCCLSPIGLPWPCSRKQTDSARARFENTPPCIIQLGPPGLLRLRTSCPRYLCCSACRICLRSEHSCNVHSSGCGSFFSGLCFPHVLDVWVPVNIIGAEFGASLWHRATTYKRFFSWTSTTARKDTSNWQAPAVPTSYAATTNRSPAAAMCAAGLQLWQLQRSQLQALDPQQ